ncbi:MAG: methyltransferase domain-containing protein [Euryarchaeota archaeon]|nr:methyltransferase domain-containing protein [Euryarchaeota archaeon]
MTTKNKKLQEKDDINKSVKELYERIASDKSPGLHLGYYEKDIKTYEEAIFNMNEFVARLLDLDSIAINGGRILDAGCGTGTTSLYLAEYYPTINFIGITFVSKEVELAIKIQYEKNIKNTKFLVGNFKKMGFASSFFDGIFALESIVYAEDKKKVLGELYRILKPNTKLVIVGAFLTSKKLSYFVQSAYDFDYKRSAHSPLEKVEDFKLYLKDIGFDDISIQDITKNTRLSFFLMTLVGLIYFFRRRKNSKFNKRRIIKNPLFHLMMMIFSPLLITLSRTSGHMAIVAVKK